MRRKSFKFRIYPTAKQKTVLVKHFGCARYIYNWGLQTKIAAYETDHKSLTCIDLINRMVSLKKQKETLWLKEAHSQTLQMALRNLDNAFTRFFKKIGDFPKFKKKVGRNSFQFPQGVKIDLNGKSIRLPKIGKIKTVFHRKFDKNAKIKTVTISRSSTGKYFMSVLVELPGDNPTQSSFSDSQTVGIDLGIKHFAVLSTGEKIDNPKFLDNNLKRLKVLQRRASKKKKGSKNRKKAYLRVAQLHEKIRNRRSDFHHKLSRRLVDENQAICLEDLAIKRMMENGFLGRQISDCGWASFVGMLEHKATVSGKTILKIGQFEPSSKLCSCGHKNDKLKLSDREWTCESCGLTHDRDILAARNIKKFALADPLIQGRIDPLSLRSRGGRRRTLRQEPFRLTKVKAEAKPLISGGSPSL